MRGRVAVRALRLVMVVGCVVLLVVGCGSGVPEGGERRGVAARVRAHLAEDGVAWMPDPPWGRVWGLRSGAGDGAHVVVNGLLRGPDGGPVLGRDPAGHKIALNDGEGWVLDVRTRWWRRMPPQPFEDPLEMSSRVMAATGGEVVFLGYPCEAWHLDEEYQAKLGLDSEGFPEVCTSGDGMQGGLQAAAFDPASNTWRRIGRSPRFLHPRFDEVRQPLTSSIRYVGWTGREVVVAPSWSRHGRRLLLLEPASGRWRWSEPPPEAMADDTLCVAGGRVIGVTGEEPLPGGTRAVDAQETVFVLDPVSLGWEPLAVYDRLGLWGPGALTDTYARELVCPWDHQADPVYVDTALPQLKAPPRLMRLDMRAGRFVPLPPPPADMTGWMVFKPVRVAGRDVYLVSDRSDLIPGGPSYGSAIFVPSPNGRAWQRAPAFMGRYAGSLVFLGEGRFLVQGEQWFTPEQLALPGGGEGVPERGRLVDLQRHLQVHGIDLAVETAPVGPDRPAGP